jgi:hypothetical protein
MSGEEPKTPNLDEQIAEAMKRAQQHPNIMGQAMQMTNMAYAFQFAQHAKPLAEIVPLAEVNENLNRLHNDKALIISVSVIAPKMDVLITYYKMES